MRKKAAVGWDQQLEMRPDKQPGAILYKFHMSLRGFRLYFEYNNKKKKTPWVRFTVKGHIKTYHYMS